MEVCNLLGKDHNCIDLTYPLDQSTIFWPGGEGFHLCMNCSSDAGYFYSAGIITCAEHGGTHVDAPYHFSEEGTTVDALPLKDLIAPCRLIDISRQCDPIATEGSNYVLSPEDILGYEREHGSLVAGDIVLIRTGFDEKTQGPYDPATSELSFPGIGFEASKLLIERKISAVGLDTASLDPGSAKDFIAHRTILGAGIYGIENVNSGIDLIPAVGSTLVVMPIKITGGSGAPARVVCILHK